jgi:adenine deaminase
MKIDGMLIDVYERDIYPARIHIKKGIIERIERKKSTRKNYMLPGLIDAHIHIESSMVTPGAFAGTAIRHGTIGVVSDPHEIGNVLGLEGVEFMIEDAEKVPLKFWFGAPSCVPATRFESSGATINSQDIFKLMERNDIKYLSEMMNFPGVIYDDAEVLKKINIAKKRNKPIDGHAAGLAGESLKKYVSAGISTDHECSNIAEAREKISLGMKVLIREGSAARNLDALKQLIIESPDMVMLCSDDLHPEMLVSGHINKIVSKLIKEGYDVFDIIRSCTVNPVRHYGLDAGLLKQGDPADFILVDDYKEMNIMETWIGGKKVYEKGKVLFKYKKGDTLNKFNCSVIHPAEIEVPRIKNKIQIIEAFDGELLTKKIIGDTGSADLMTSDINKDVLKIVVKDRYTNAPPAIAFIKGFGLKKGAFASSVAHDSHNIICVGTNDIDIVSAINEIVMMKGGLAVSTNGLASSLKLNIGGIMSDSSCEEIANAYEALSNKVKSLGCKLRAPYMTLSFMALLVIPELKIGDKGLFDVINFCPTSLFVD